MAKALLISRIRKSLSDWIEDDKLDLDVQIANGRLELTNVRLRPDLDLLDSISSASGCCVKLVSSQVPRLSVTWSWTNLLRTPVEVKVEGVDVLLAASPARYDIQSCTSAKTKEPLQQPETDGYFGRMVRRIWSNLQLELSNLRLACEVTDREDLVGCTRHGQLGLVWENLLVANSCETGAQTVDLSGIACYLAPPDQPWHENCFLFPSNSRSCAKRTSGRRFVDWRGLELELSLHEVEFSWTEKQHTCLAGMQQCLRSSDAAPKEGDQSDLQDDSPLQSNAISANGPFEGELAVPSKSSWFGSLSAWWGAANEPTTPAPEPSLDDLSCQDRELLIQESDETAAENASFSLKLCWENASLSIMHGLLLRSHGVARYDLLDSGKWATELVLRKTQLLDRAASTAICIQREEFDEEDLVVSIGQQSIVITVGPLSVAPTTVFLQSAMFLLSCGSDVPSKVLDSVPGISDLPFSLVIHVKRPQLLLRASPDDVLLIVECDNVEIQGKHCKLDRMQLQASATGLLAKSEGMDHHFLAVPGELIVISDRSGVVCKIAELNVKITPPELLNVMSLNQWLSHELSREGTYQASSDGVQSSTRSFKASVSKAHVVPSPGSFLEIGNLQASLDELGQVTMTTCLTVISPEMPAGRHLVEKCGLSLSQCGSKFSVESSDGISASGNIADFRRLRSCIETWYDAISSTGDSNSSWSLVASIPTIEVVILGGNAQQAPQASVSAWDFVLRRGVVTGGEYSASCTSAVIEPRKLPGSIRLRQPLLTLSPSRFLTCIAMEALEFLNLDASTAVEARRFQATVECPHPQGSDVDPPFCSSPDVGILSLDIHLLEVSIDSTEAFLSGCIEAIYDLSQELSQVFVRTADFEERPLGLTLNGLQVSHAEGRAEQQGIHAGCTLVGTCSDSGEQEQFAGEHCADILRTRPVPMSILFYEPPSMFDAAVTVTAFPLEVKRLQKLAHLSVRSFSMAFQKVSFTEPRSTLSSTLYRLKDIYVEDLRARAPEFLTAISVAGFDAKTLGETAVAAIAASPLGGVAGVAGAAVVKGIAQTVHRSSQRGKQIREGAGDGYQFGDITRGVLDLARERGQQARRQRGAPSTSFPSEDRFLAGPEDLEDDGLNEQYSCGDVTLGAANAVATFVKDEKVVQGTAGAAIGGVLGGAAGPAGCVVGSMVGAAVGKNVANITQTAVRAGKQSRGADPETSGYKFGDLTRGIISSATGGASARSGSWRYDDINPLAKANPLRYTAKESLVELLQDLGKNAANGRPIYVEAGGAKRVCRDKFDAIEFVRSLQ